MIIHLLDRNLVIEIRDHVWPTPVKISAVAGMPTPPRNPTLDKAKSLDKKNRKISALLSIMEGTQRVAPSEADLKQVLYEETASLKRFYCHAETDEAYLKSNDLTVCSALASEVKRESDTYLAATNTLRGLLATQNSKQETKLALKGVINVAHDHGLPLANPLIMCAIASVYGSEDARRVIKPSKSPMADESYNAIMDLSKIKLVNYLRHIGKVTSRDLKFETMDRALLRFSSFLHVRSTSSVLNSTHDNFSTSVDPDVFLNNLPFLRELKKQKQELRALLLSS